jgi:hypothetical protein
VAFDKSEDPLVIRITDVASYPSGVEPGVSGVVSILQPDGIEVTGDIEYSSGNLQPVEIELRLATDDNFQRGKYTITYTISHASYDDTVYTKEFHLFFQRPNVTIEPDFDVFTPSLKVNDTTVYAIPGFTLVSSVRSWDAVITNVGEVTGSNSAIFDVKYGGAYYDSAYFVTLTDAVTYYLNADSSVSVIDVIEVEASYRTEVPTPLNDLFAKIISFKNSIDDKNCCCKVPDGRQKFSYLISLFEYYKMRGTCGTDMDTLMEIQHEIDDMLNDCGVVYTNTYLPISAFSFNNFCGIPGNPNEIPNTPPTVNAGADQTITLPTSSVSLTATATGTALTYAWTKISGPSGSSFGTPTALTTTVTGLTEGTHVFRITVTDDQDQTAYDQLQIIVNPEAGVTEHLVQYGWTSTPVTSSNVDDVVLDESITVTNGATEFSVTIAIVFLYVVFAEPSDEPLKTEYTNVLNNEPIPDYTFDDPVVIGSTRYYFTRAPRSFDGSGPTTLST